MNQPAKYVLLLLSMMTLMLHAQGVNHRVGGEGGVRTISVIPSPAVPVGDHALTATLGDSIIKLQATLGINLADSAYGAGTCTGSNDTAAFQAAAAAAHALYVTTGSAVAIHLPAGRACTLGTSTPGASGHVTYGSGVWWEGPGIINVPVQSTQETLLAVNADNVAVENIVFNIQSNGKGCSGLSNNILCLAFGYRTTSAESNRAHHSVLFRNNQVWNSDWGILVAVLGSDTLNNIDIEGNFVGKSNYPGTTLYQGADSIHVGGAVTGITISGNKIEGGGDAGIALSSEAGTSGVQVCSGATVEDNVLLDDRVGLDNSGCSNATWKGNYVVATLATNVSNPAFRSIYYYAVPVNVVASNNVLQNYFGPGTDKTAKFDCFGGCAAALTSSFTDNTVTQLYIRGSSVDTQGNSFVPNGSRLPSYEGDYDGTHLIASNGTRLGTNTWHGNGTITAGANPALFTNDYLARQSTTGSLTYRNRSNWILF